MNNKSNITDLNGQVTLTFALSDSQEVFERLLSRKPKLIRREITSYLLFVRQTVSHNEKNVNLASTPDATIQNQTDTRIALARENNALDALGQAEEGVGVNEAAPVAQVDLEQNAGNCLENEVQDEHLRAKDETEEKDAILSVDDSLHSLKVENLDEAIDCVVKIKRLDNRGQVTLKMLAETAKGFKIHKTKELKRTLQAKKSTENPPHQRRAREPQEEIGQTQRSFLQSKAQNRLRKSR